MKAEPPIGARRRQRPALVVGEETKEEEINRERPWRSPLVEERALAAAAQHLWKSLGWEVNHSASSTVVSSTGLLSCTKVPQIFIPVAKQSLCVGTEIYFLQKFSFILLRSSNK